MTTNLITSLIAVATICISAWAFFKYVILLEVRIEPALFKKIYGCTESCWKLIFAEEIKLEKRAPVDYMALIKFSGYPAFYLTNSERLLNAGWHGKDQVARIICLRWQYKGIQTFLSDLVQDKIKSQNKIPVYLITPNFVDEIGKIKTNIISPVQPKEIWYDLDQMTKEVVETKDSKVGFILHGPPGNGKTSFIKYLSEKYNLPIFYITFSPEYDNFSILLMFAQIPPKSLVILEDFDSYFDGRNCVMQNFAGSSNGAGGARFTFDTIINSLDGVYTSYDRNVFILTSNNIDKIDDSLKYRPSRFKVVREFPNPNKSVIRSFLSESWSNYTHDINYDQLIRLAEFQRQGISFTQAYHMLCLKLPGDVYTLAENISKNKSEQNINTTDEMNFLEACNQFNLLVG